MGTAPPTLKERIASWLLPIGLLGLLVLAWYLLASHEASKQEPNVPSPSETIVALWTNAAQLASDSWYTMKEVALGFVLTIAASLVVALLLHVASRVSKGLHSVLVVVQCVPLWAIAPVLLLLTGPGMRTRLLIVVLVAFFPVVVNTLEGLESINPELSEVFDSLNASRRQRLVRLEIPGALSVVLAGFKITLTLCVIGAVLAEILIGDMIGLGYRVKSASAHFDMPLVFASLLALSVVAMLLYGVLSWIASRAQPWLLSKED